jgi:hypothetical protein
MARAIMLLRVLLPEKDANSGLTPRGKRIDLHLSYPLRKSGRDSENSHALLGFHNPHLAQMVLH